MNGHCCGQNGRQKIDERHQHAGGTKKTKHQPGQRFDCAFRLSVARDEHIFKVAAQRHHLDHDSGDAPVI